MSHELVRCLNIAGLALTTLAAILMWLYPPQQVERVTRDGEPIFEWTGAQTEKSKASAARHKLMARLGPALLSLGFALLLFAAVCGP